MKIIDNQLINNVIEQAKQSPRLRMHYDLRDTTEDPCMRMLNALEPGTGVPIHRHSKTSEDVICIRGCVEEVLYDAEGKEVERYRLQPGTECMACHVPMDQYHTCISLESGSVIVEFKNGKYDQLTTEIFLNQES